MSMQRMLNQKRDIPVTREGDQAETNDLPDLPTREEQASPTKPEIGPEGYRVGDLVDYVDKTGVRFKSLPIQRFAGRPGKDGKRPYVYLGSPATIEFVAMLHEITPTRRRISDS